MFDMKPKSLGQVAYEAYHGDMNDAPWDTLSIIHKDCWERAARAVILASSK